MKKILILVTLLLCGAYYLNAVDSPTISITGVTPTTMRFSISGMSADTTITDTLVIVVSSAVNDSAGGATNPDYEFVVSPRDTTEYTATGLTIGVKYYPIARVDSQGTKAYSNRDTSYTQNPQLEPVRHNFTYPVGTDLVDKKAWYQTPWIAPAFDGTFNIAASDSDSTAVYYSTGLMSLLFKTDDADSTAKIYAILMAGHADITVQDSTGFATQPAFDFAPIDTLDITSTATNIYQFDSIDLNEMFYIKFVPYKGNTVLTLNGRIIRTSE